MDLSYLITPFIAWFITGVTKFLVNTLREKRLAFELIGYGGFPSNHSAIVASMASLIGFEQGIDTPSFGVAIALAYIVVLDANSLRRKIGKQAEQINLLSENTSLDLPKLRERVGHSKIEIIAGLALGALVGFVVHLF